MKLDLLLTQSRKLSTPQLQNDGQYTRLSTCQPIQTEVQGAQSMSHCASVLDFFASLLLVPRKNFGDAHNRPHYGVMTTAPSTESLFSAINASFAWASGKTVILGRRFIAAAI